MTCHLAYAPFVLSFGFFNPSEFFFVLHIWGNLLKKNSISLNLDPLQCHYFILVYFVLFYFFETNEMNFNEQ
jgi:hypothetical protein